MEKVTELIIIAVDVIVTALVMVIAFSLYSQGQNLSNFVSSDINTSSTRVNLRMLRLGPACMLK